MHAGWVGYMFFTKRVVYQNSIKFNGTLPTDTFPQVTSAIRYSGLGVRSVGPLGDFLECEPCFAHDLSNEKHPSCLGYVVDLATHL